MIKTIFKKIIEKIKNFSSQMNGLKYFKTFLFCGIIFISLFSFFVNPQKVSSGINQCPPEYPSLLVLISMGNGVVEGGGCYDTPEQALAIASPNAGSVFDYWSGDCSGSDYMAAVNMDSDKTCYAYFKDAPVASCSSPWGGAAIASGSSVTAYSTSTVAYGSTCTSQTRTCNNGSLDGSYTYGSCSVNPPSNCSVLPWGAIAHGASVPAYSVSTVPYGAMCLEETRTCNNGTLSGSGAYASCTVTAAANCYVSPWGEILDGNSVTAYSSYNPTGACTSQARSCGNGSLSGTYVYNYCNAGCTGTLWGNVSHGYSNTAYSTSSVAWNASCASQTRSCSSGTFSGTYGYTSCAPVAPLNCTGTWGTVNHASALTTYTTSEATYPTTCASNGSQTCTNGTGVSGYASCAQRTNGTCNNATAFACSYGTSVSNVTNPSNWTWGCNGINGGTSTGATSCSLTKAACTGTWGTVASGSSLTTYTTSTATSPGSTCTSNGSQLCNNGAGVSGYASCTQYYTATFNSNGGTPTYSTATYTAGANVTSPGSPTRTGYSFTSWGLGAMPAANTTYTAGWSPNGCSSPCGNIASGGTCTAWAASTADTCSSQTRTCSAGSLDGSYAYAGCTVNAYTYNFNGNGATGNASPTSVYQNYGTGIATPSAPSRTGYTFTGWSPGIPGTMPSGGGTSYAQWADQTVPTTPGNISVSWVGDHYINTSATVSTSGASDSGSGIRGYRLCRSQDNAGGCYTWTANGEHAGLSEVISGADLPSAGTFRYYYWYAYDNAGNQSGTSGDYIRMDGAAPSTPGAMTTSWTGDHYVNTNFTAATSGSSDAGTGVSYYNLCMSVDNGGSASCDVWVATGIGSSYTVSGTHLPSNGTYRYYTWYAYDAFGNQSGQSSGTYVRMDSSAPYLSSKTGYGGWYTANQISTFTYTDSNSGVSSGNNPTCTISAEGSGQTCTLAAAANVCDVAGNCVSPNGQVSNGANIDKTAPYISSKTTYSGWYNANQTSTFTYADATSGVSSGNNPSCTISAEGAGQTCSVTPNVCDAAGNCNATAIASNGASIDKTVPSVSTGIGGGWNPGTGIGASDATSGLASYTLYVNDVARTWQNYSNICSLLSLGDGTNTIRVVASDNAGNSNSTGNQNFSCDRTAPVFSSKTTYSGWYATNQTSTFTYTDATSGVASGNNQTCTISAEGAGQTCTMSAAANVCDVAGNCVSPNGQVSNGANMQMTPTASITNSPVNYNGSAQTATVACLGGGTATLATGGTGTNAGSYPATVNCVASTSYKAASGLAAGSFVINKITPTAWITNSPVTFNGGTQTAAVACTAGGTATISSGGSGVNAGTYATTVNCATSTNYNAASGLAAGNFVINQIGSQTASIDTTSVSYTGSPISKTVTCNGGGTPAPATVSGTNVGSYSGSGITCAATTNYAASSSLTTGSFSITKIAQAAVTLSAQTVTYPTTFTTLSAAGGSGTGAYSYAVTSAGAGCSIAGTTLSYTSAGTCGVTATKALDTNYNVATSAVVTFTINAAPQTASISTASATYTGSAISRTVTCSGGGTPTPASVSGTTVGTYTATISCSAIGNYALTGSLNPGSFSITQASQSTPTVTAQTINYGQSFGALAATGGSSTGGYVFALGAAGSAGCSVAGTTLSFANAGTCTVTVYKAGDTNYVVSSTSAAQTFTVNQIGQTAWLADTSSAVYTGSAISRAVSCTSGTPSPATVSGTTVGSYSGSGITCSGTTNYYAVGSLTTASFSITQASQSTPTVTTQTINYGQSFGALAATGGSSIGGYVFALGAAGSAGCSVAGTTLSFGTAGTCTVTVYKAGDTNYVVSSTSAAQTFTVNKINPSPVMTVNNSATYDGTGKAATLTLTGTAGAASNILTGGAASQTNAGTYAVTATFTPTDTTNYNSLPLLSAGNFIINKATPTISVSNTPQNYTGAGLAAAISSSVAGTPSSILTGGSATQINVGTYAVTANFAPTDSTNYNSLTAAAAGNFVINKINQPTLSVTSQTVTYPTTFTTLVTTGGGGDRCSYIYSS